MPVAAESNLSAVLNAQRWCLHGNGLITFSSLWTHRAQIQVREIKFTERQQFKLKFKNMWSKT